MVVLVLNVGGAGDGFVDTGLPGGIGFVLCDLEAMGDGGREHVVYWRMVPWKVSDVARWLHWRGPRWSTHGHCLPARGQQYKGSRSRWGGVEDRAWGEGWCQVVRCAG